MAHANAYSEIHPDLKGVTCAGFLTRAVEFFADHGITVEQVITDNAKEYQRSHAFRDAAAAHEVAQLVIPRTAPGSTSRAGSPRGTGRRGRGRTAPCR